MATSTTDAMNSTSDENVTKAALTPRSATSFYVMTSTMSPDDTITWDDATWILTSAFIIFTMQSGQSRVFTAHNEQSLNQRCFGVGLVLFLTHSDVRPNFHTVFLGLPDNWNSILIRTSRTSCIVVTQVTKTSVSQTFRMN